MTCATCRYWKRAGVLSGNCRRHPPKAFWIPPESGVLEGGWANVYPATDEIDWCGEYQRDPVISKTEG